MSNFYKMTKTVLAVHLSGREDEQNRDIRHCRREDNVKKTAAKLVSCASVKMQMKHIHPHTNGLLLTLAAGE